MRTRIPAAPDLLALGAAALPTLELLRVVTRDRLGPGELTALAGALALGGAARDAALRASRVGPELFAALELGRRAQLWPHAAGRRVHGPTDVVAVVGPRAANDVEELWALALDCRMKLARALPVAHGDEESLRCSPARVLGPVLGAGCRRVVLAHRHPGPSRPSASDERATLELATAGALVDVAVLDHVILGDDGHTSLLRTGLLPARDRRYG